VPLQVTARLRLGLGKEKRVRHEREGSPAPAAAPDVLFYESVTNALQNGLQPSA
jgi:hypothetical protein